MLGLILTLKSINNKQSKPKQKCRLETASNETTGRGTVEVCVCEEGGGGVDHNWFTKPTKSVRVTKESMLTIRIT